MIHWCQCIVTHVSISAGGLVWAGAAVVDTRCKVVAADFKDGLCVLRVGKKRAFVVRLK